MHRSFKIGILLLFCGSCILLSGGCEEVVENTVTESIPPRLVVDAQFTDEPGAHFVRLTWSVPLHSNEPAPAASRAMVTVSDGRHVYPFVENTPGSGIYYTEAAVKGEAGKTYTLLIAHEGKTYTATETMQEVTGLAPVENYRPESPQSNFYLWDVPNIHSVHAGTSYEWHVILTPPTGGTLQKELEFVYYNFTGLETSALFQLNEMSQTLRFEKGTTLTQKKYSLSPHYYHFLKAMYTETDWRGGLYDASPANVPTNLSGGATGFFRVSAVTSLSQVIR